MLSPFQTLRSRCFPNGLESTVREEPTMAMSPAAKAHHDTEKLKLKAALERKAAKQHFENTPSRQQRAATAALVALMAGKVK